MSQLRCCGKHFASKFSLRRHTNTMHRIPVPVFRCYVEGCIQRFNTVVTLELHQKEHLYSSNIFYMKSHAFNRTTLVLRKDLLEEGYTILISCVLLRVLKKKGEL